MKILICGGYHAFGSNLAIKFQKKGHEVTLIDKLPVKENINGKLEKYKFYNILSSSAECEKIFGAGRFEIVIFIPSPELMTSGSKESPVSEEILSDLNMSGLVNMLDLSTKNKIKKFVLISSAEIYGNTSEVLASEETTPNPVSVKGMSSYVMEYYCFRWSKINILNTLCIRASSVYGPRISASGDWLKHRDPISELLESIVRSEEITIRGSGMQTGDFIYIDDFIDGVYEAAVNKDCLGVLNLSSGIERSINSIVEELLVIKKPKRITRLKNEKEKIQPFRIDNSRISRILNWQPKVSFKEGLKITYDRIHLQAEDEKLKKHRCKKGEVKRKNKPAAIIAYIENIVIFIFTALMQYGNIFFNLKLPDLKMDYSIIYIVIIGIIWGQTQAYIAMFLAAALYLGISIFTGTDIITFVYTPENLIRIAAYILVGIVTGYSIERKNRELESRDYSIQNLQNKYIFLSDIYKETRIVKNELENQVIETEDSFSTIYKIIQEVDSLEIEKVFSGAISAIERIMRTGQVSIYTLAGTGNNNFMRLKARSLTLLDKTPNSIKISDFNELFQVIQTKSAYINRSLKKGIPVMMAPVTEDKNVIAVISIHSTTFENLTLHYENLFQTVVGLITSALKRAYFFEASLKDKRYIPNTRVLTSYTFEKILKEIQNSKVEFGMSYTLLKVEREGLPLQEISERTSRVIRDNDYIGTGQNGITYILLSNTGNNYAGLVLERLKKAGVSASLLTEDFDVK